MEPQIELHRRLKDRPKRWPAPVAPPRRGREPGWLNSVTAGVLLTILLHVATNVAFNISKHNAGYPLIMGFAQFAYTVPAAELARAFGYRRLCRGFYVGAIASFLLWLGACLFILRSIKD